MSEERGKVIPRRRHSKIGFFGIGGEDRPQPEGSAPGWLWLLVGAGALVAVLMAAIGITTRQPPFRVPGASPVQFNRADSLHRALEKDSLNSGGFVRLADLLYDTQNYEMAVPYYRRALALDRTLVDAQVDLAVALHQSGHTGEALAELEQVLAGKPEHAVARFDLGVIYEFMGRLDDAEEAYKLAASYDIEPQLAFAIEQRLRAIETKRSLAGDG